MEKRMKTKSGETMKKLSILILCLTLCNCQLYINELNRQKGIITVSEKNKEKVRQICPEYYDDVVSNKASIGMPEECLRIGWGKPIRTNKSCHSGNGCLTQYVYRTSYIYIKNGKVTSWQSR